VIEAMPKLAADLDEPAAEASTVTRLR
jgi:hypothetical protein